MKTLLWLDDTRDPFHKLENGESWLSFSPIEQPFDLSWVKSYDEFVAFIKFNGLPDAICFDHDLGDYQAIHAAGFIDGGLPENEKTGYDCAKWLVEYCISHDLGLPKYNIQSSNPVGKENINSILKSFNKIQQRI